MKILDLFCGAGGAAMGLHRVFPGADIHGVDLALQPNYPFNFIHADVLHLQWDDAFDFIWASPPCQRYVCERQGWPSSRHPDLIGPVRKLLLKTGTPFVIENVRKAPLRPDLVLCGTMFDLKVFRHRYFEIEGFQTTQPRHYKHQGSVYTGEYCTVYNGGDGVGGYGTDIVKRRAARQRMKTLGVRQTFERWCAAMDIDWMTRDELTQAIPPAYSEYIAREFQRTSEQAQ